MTLHDDTIYVLMRKHSELVINNFLTLYGMRETKRTFLQELTLRSMFALIKFLYEKVLMIMDKTVTKFRD